MTTSGTKISSANDGRNGSMAQINRCGWRKIFFGVRIRILAWYIVLMAFSALVSILAIRQILLDKVI
jgi:hypothetical protein